MALLAASAAMRAGRCPRPPQLHSRRCSRTTTRWRRIRAGTIQRCGCSASTGSGSLALGRLRPELRRRSPGGASTATIPRRTRARTGRHWTGSCRTLSRPGSGIDLDAMGPPRSGRSAPAARRAPAIRTGSPRPAFRAVRARAGRPLQRQLQPGAEEDSCPATGTTCRGSRSGRSGTSPTTVRASPPRASRATSPSRTARGCTGTWSTRLGPRSIRPGTARDTFIFGELAPRGMRLLGRVLRHEAARVPARDVLRRLELSPAHRHGRRAAWLPDDRRGQRRFRAQNPGVVPGQRRISDHPYMRWYPPNREQNPDPTTGSWHGRLQLARRDRQPRARARPTPGGVRLAHAILDLEHRVRLHHQPAEARQPARDQTALPLPVGDAIDGRLLPQLGRIHLLEGPADRLFLPVPAA